MTCILPSGSAGTIVEDYRRHGPLIDKLIYRVITGHDQQVLALEGDEIDLIGESINPDYLSELEEAEDIGIARTLRNGYGYLTIKCNKYPFNVIGFRRALAFALDKWRISAEIWGNLSEPLDSCIPKTNPFSIEGQLPYTYYEANVAKGNQLLDAAGFFDIDNDTYREGPHSDDFDVLIEVASSSEIAIGIGAKCAEALQALHVDATSQPTDFYEYLNRLYFHGDYDIVFVGASFSDFDVDWLAYEYWSEYADEPYWNFPCFQNASYDSWRDQLLYSTDYDDVYEAAIEMQRVWVYECPMIICYENVLLSAYRTDKFEGFVNDVSDGPHGWWTNYKVHLKQSQGGPLGGTFRWSNSLDVDTFNFMASSSVYTKNVLNELYDSLLIRDGQGRDMLWLAESYIAETHADNLSVPEGHTRFTFNLIENATWTDGYPLTAEDVAYTMNYYRSGSGNPYGADLAEMTAAYQTSTYQAIVEFGSESYWHLHTVGYKPIIPKHVFLLIGPSGWNSWNPHPPTEDMVTSGPFTVSEYVAGEFCELSKNPYYFYRIMDMTDPTIDNPGDVLYEQGSTGNSITWHPWDENPAFYIIVRDGVPFGYGFWNSSSEVISVSVDGLSPGAHNFTIMVFDVPGHYTTDTVWVTVTADTTDPTISHPEDFTYERGQVKDNVTWHPLDLNPASYQVLRNGSVIASGPWNSTLETISISIGDWTPGVYNVTIIVTDTSSNYATDTVWVTVTEQSFWGGLFGGVGGVVAIGSIAVIVVLGTLIVRSRRQ